MKIIKNIMLLTVIMVMTLSLTACSNAAPENNVQQPTQTETPVEVVEQPVETEVEKGDEDAGYGVGLARVVLSYTGE